MKLVTLMAVRLILDLPVQQLPQPQIPAVPAIQQGLAPQALPMAGNTPPASILQLANTIIPPSTQLPTSYNTGTNATPAAPLAVPVTGGQQNVNSQYGQAPAECLIPGCGQLAHTDASGQTSEYCSMRHRE